MWSDRLLEYSAFLTSPSVDPNESAPGSPAQPLCSVAANFDAGSPEIHLNTHAAMRLMSSIFFRRGKDQIKVGVSTSDVKRLEPAMRHLWIQSGLPHAGRNRTFVDNMKDVLFRGTTAEQELLEPSESQTCDDDSRDASQQVFTDDYRQMFNYLEIIRRAVFLSKDGEAMQLPSYRAVELHVNRATLVFRLALECASGHQPSLEAWKEPNSGWSGSSESDIRIVWDDQVQTTLETNQPQSRSRQSESCTCGRSLTPCRKCACVTAKRPCITGKCQCDPATCKNPLGHIVLHELGQQDPGIGTNEGDSAGAQQPLEECQESRVADEYEISPVTDEAEQDVLAGLIVVDDDADEEEASNQQMGHTDGDFFEGIEEGGNDGELSGSDDLVGSFLADN